MLVLADFESVKLHLIIKGQRVVVGWARTDLDKTTNEWRFWTSCGEVCIKAKHPRVEIHNGLKTAVIVISEYA